MKLFTHHSQRLWYCAETVFQRHRAVLFAKETSDQLLELNRRPTNDLPTRAEQLKSLEETPEFDVLVIGGGATGCGVALDSVSRGTVRY